MNNKDICKEVIAVSKEAGTYLLNERQKIKNENIETKGLHDYVTYVDRQSERIIVNGLRSVINDAGFLTEEKTESETNKNYQWIIDPLDGTTNFIHNVPCFSTSIALALNNEIVVGVIYDIIQNEIFYAWKDGGAFMNDKPIKVSETKDLNSSLLATGFPYYDYDKLDQYIEFLKFTMRQTRGIRRLGSAAIDLAWVACGRFDGFYEYGLNPWDVAAGIILVKEAGGVATDFNGENNLLFGKEIITTNKNIFPEFLSQIKKHFKE